MTLEQIDAVLYDLNYSLDTEIIPKEISTIYIILDHVIYTSKTTIFNFSTEENANLLLIYEGKQNKEGYIEKETDYPTYIIPFSAIAGFNLVSPYRVSEPYKFGRSI